MTDERRFGFEEIVTDRPEEGRALGSEIDRAAERLGFVAREPAEVAIKRVRGTEKTVHQFTMRVTVSASNKFVLWCERHRLSYREGFEKLVAHLD